MLKIYREKLLAVLSRERVICRLIAAWCTYAVLMLLRHGDFTDLAFGQQESLSSLLGAVAISFVFYTLIAAVAGVHLHTDSWFLFCTVTVCAWIWLIQFHDSKNALLFSLAVAIAYTLFLIYIVHVNKALLQSFRLEKTTLCVCVIALTLISGGVIALITCLRYKTFSAPNFDFGLFCNMFYNMKESGLPMVTSERDMLLSHFAVHISPVYYLFLPFFYLFPTPMTLQIGQAVVLALGVIPVVLLARHFQLSNKVTLIFAALYLFFPALSAGCFYDLHENCFLPLFLLLTFLFYEKKKYVPMYLCAVLVLSVKEDAAIYLLIFAVFLLLAEKSYLHGGILAALSVGYFLLCGFLLEHYGQGMMVNRFDNLIYNKDDGLLGAIKTALVNPGYLLTQLFTTSKSTWEKIAYVLQMLLPLGLLPFCSKKCGRWLLVAPILVNLLTYYVYQYDIGFQYHFGILAFLVYAAIKNLPELSPSTQQTLLTVALSCTLCLYAATVVPEANGYLNRWNNGQDTYSQMEEMLETIPDDASVSASTFLVAHLADRSEIYELADHKYKTDTDYVIFDTRYAAQESDIQIYLNSGYEIVGGRENLLAILKKCE